MIVQMYRNFLGTAAVCMHPWLICRLNCCRVVDGEVEVIDALWNRGERVKQDLS
jgi:hypothetical protein